MAPLTVHFRGAAEEGGQNATALPKNSSATDSLVLESKPQTVDTAPVVREDKGTDGGGHAGEVPPLHREVAQPAVSAATGLAVPVPRPYYFPSKVLQLSPVPDQRLVFQYPPELAGSKGRVVLAVYINEKGIVDWSEVVESTDERFTEASKTVIEKTRYRPGILADRFVKSLWLVEVTFAPEGVAAVTSETKQ